MFYNDEIRQDPFDNDIDINITNQNVNSNMNTNQMYQEVGGYPTMGMGMTSPIVEMPRERCVYRSVVHEVPQECPFM